MAPSAPSAPLGGPPLASAPSPCAAAAWTPRNASRASWRDESRVRFTKRRCTLMPMLLAAPSRTPGRDAPGGSSSAVMPLFSARLPVYRAAWRSPLRANSSLSACVTHGSRLHLTSSTVRPNDSNVGASVCVSSGGVCAAAAAGSLLLSSPRAAAAGSDCRPCGGGVAAGASGCGDVARGGRTQVVLRVLWSM